MRADPALPGPQKIWVMNADGSDQRALSAGLHDEFADPAWSPDNGRIAFTNWLGGGLWLMNADGMRQRRLTRGHDSAPDWSPDGRRIIFCRQGSGSRYSEIYAVNANGSKPVVLTRATLSTSTALKPEPVLTAPTWSPNGKRIAYLVSSGPDQSEIWMMNADGSRKRRLVASANVLTGRPAWSPDGRSIAFASSRTGQSDIYILDITDGRLRNLTRNKAADGMPAWSPDGHRLAFISSRDQGTMDIYVMDIDTRRVTRLTTDAGDDTEPAWASSAP